MNESKILAFREPFWSLFAEKFFDCVKILVCGKRPWSRKKRIVGNFFVCGKFPWSSKVFLWKISLTVENLFVCGKFMWSRKSFLWKISFSVENYLDCWQITWSRKVSLTVEKFLDQRNFPWQCKTYFLDCRKNNETYILSLEQKLSSLTFFCGR